jgi:hypothetical protein
MVAGKALSDCCRWVNAFDVYEAGGQGANQLIDTYAQINSGGTGGDI